MIMKSATRRAVYSIRYGLRRFAIVNVNRTSLDSVVLSHADSRYNLIVNRPGGKKWTVTRRLVGQRSGGFILGEFATAEEAVQAARDYLASGKDELDEALRSL